MLCKIQISAAQFSIADLLEIFHAISYVFLYCMSVFCGFLYHDKQGSSQSEKMLHM